MGEGCDVKFLFDAELRFLKKCQPQEFWVKVKKSRAEG
jgi:hypothetical protein